jgi:PEP-CTERM motif-containing protein
MIQLQVRDAIARLDKIEIFYVTVIFGLTFRLEIRILAPLNEYEKGADQEIGVSKQFPLGGVRHCRRGDRYRRGKFGRGGHSLFRRYQSFNAAPGSLSTQSFALDHGGFLGFGHFRTSSGTLGAALFAIGGASVSAQFVGSIGANTHYRYPSRLAFGDSIAGRAFVPNRPPDFLATLAFGSGYAHSHWLDTGTGFIGFKFNGGAGVEYGWAQVTMNSGTPGNTFTVVDYAWADAGTAITAGQTAVPEPGSLGLLALGGVGLIVWRKRRAKAIA